MTQIDISYRRIVQITAPVVASHLCHTTTGIVDTIMVGQLGVTALGAVGLANIITFTLFSFFWGLLSGAATLVAQAVGAGDRRAAAIAFWQGAYLALVSALAIVVLSPLVLRIPTWAGGSSEMQAIAGQYMRIRLLGALGFLLLVAVDSFYRGLGRTRVLLWFGMAEMGLNCFLNYLLIFGKLGAPRLGIAGAAWGSVLAQLLVALALAITLVGSTNLRSKFQILASWRFHPRVFRTLVKLSLPIGLQIVMENGGVTLFCAVVARLGDAEMAATNAVIQGWSVAFMTVFALSVGATTLVGQCVGAGQVEDARRVVGRILRLGYAVTAAVALIYLAFPEALMNLFVVEAEVALVQHFARPLFTVVVLCLFFDARYQILAGALRGAGDTTYAMLVNGASTWLLFVPVTLLVTPRFGLIGGWMCLILLVVLLATVLGLRFRGQAWLKPPQERAVAPMRQGGM